MGGVAIFLAASWPKQSRCNRIGSVLKSQPHSPLVCLEISVRRSSYGPAVLRAGQGGLGRLVVGMLRATGSH